MSEFMAAAAVLLALVVAVFIWPVWRAKRIIAVNPSTTQGSAQRSDENLALYREHLAELDSELAQQRIDQAQHDRLSAELQRNFLADQDAASERAFNLRGGSILLLSLVLLIVFSGWLYLSRGSSADVLFSQMQQKLELANMQAFRDGKSPDAQPTRELISAIESRLERHPENTQYWYLLGRYGSQVGDFSAAERGFRGVYQRAPSDPGNASALAQAIFLNNGNQINDEIDFLVTRALVVDDKDTTALGLAGIMAFERQEFADAARLWGTAVNQTPEGAPGRDALMSGVARARAEARRQASASGEAKDEQPATQETAGWSIPVTVSVAPELQLPADGTLFLYARAYQGSPMPLVVTRLPAAQLPTTIVLDETMAMTNVSDLLAQGSIEIVARVSVSGQVAAAAGDLQGLLGPLQTDKLPETLTVVIDTQL